MADTKRTYRPFRFPYGDKGQKNRDAFQSCLRERGFSKVNDIINTGEEDLVMLTIVVKK